MVARQPDRLHDGLRSGHVKRNLVHARQVHEARGIVGDHRMIGAQYRAERAHVLDGAIDALLVEIVPEKIDAVGAGEVVIRIPVEVGRRDSGRGLQKCADRQMPAHVGAELKGDAISLGELQIRDQTSGFGRQPYRLGISSAVEIREPRKIGAPLRHDVIRCSVGLEDPRFAVFIERHPRGHDLGDAWVPGERSVLRPGELQPRPHARRRRREDHGTNPVASGGRGRGLCRGSHYSMILTEM